MFFYSSKIAMWVDDIIQIQESKTDAEIMEELEVQNIEKLK